MNKARAAPNSRKAQAEASRRRILEAAVEHFTREPFDAVSVSDVAAAAGTATGLVFHYFQSKRGLYLAALREAAQKLDAAHALPKDGSVRERCRGMLFGHLTFMRSHPELVSALFRGGIGADAEAWEIFEEGRLAAIGYFCVALELDPSHPALRLMVRAITAAFDEATLQWIRQSEPMPIGQLVDVLLDLLAAAIRCAANLDPQLDVEHALTALSHAEPQCDRA